MKLSSPCGDKLQLHLVERGKPRVSYRPLAGISCNISGFDDQSTLKELSSPCGDKLQ